MKCWCEKFLVCKVKNDCPTTFLWWDEQKSGLNFKDWQMENTMKKIIIYLVLALQYSCWVQPFHHMKQVKYCVKMPSEAERISIQQQSNNEKIIFVFVMSNGLPLHTLLHPLLDNFFIKWFQSPHPTFGMFWKAKNKILPYHWVQLKSFHMHISDGRMTW